MKCDTWPEYYMCNVSLFICLICIYVVRSVTVAHITSQPASQPVKLLIASKMQWDTSHWKQKRNILTCLISIDGNKPIITWTTNLFVVRITLTMDLLFYRLKQRMGFPPIFSSHFTTLTLHFIVLLRLSIQIYPLHKWELIYWVHFFCCSHLNSLINWSKLANYYWINTFGIDHHCMRMHCIHIICICVLNSVLF